MDCDSIIPQNQNRPHFSDVPMKFNYLVGMIADQNFYDVCFTFFYPTASATAYDRRLKFVKAKHSATSESENYAYGPKLVNTIVRPTTARLPQSR